MALASPPSPSSKLRLVLAKKRILEKEPKTKGSVYQFGVFLFTFPAYLHFWASVGFMVNFRFYICSFRFLIVFPRAFPLSHFSVAKTHPPHRVFIFAIFSPFPFDFIGVQATCLLSLCFAFVAILLAGF